MSEQRIELVVSKIVHEPSPVVLLHDKLAKRCVPIWIGDIEAEAMELAFVDKATTKPRVHDLLASTIRLLDGTVKEVSISKLGCGQYQAVIILDSKYGEYRLESRASDGIILALKTGAPIYGSLGLLRDKSAFAGSSSSPVKKDWQKFLQLADPSDFEYEM